MGRSDMQMLMDKYNAPGADRVTAMREKVKDINDSLMDGIDKILERQEKIDLLVNRSNQLAESSVAFRRDAQSVRRWQWWRRAKIWVCIISLALVVIMVVLFSTCGITLRH